MPRRYNAFSAALRKRYPFAVRKIPIDAGFTCPNRDGVKATGGCTYCENRSFAPGAVGPPRTIERQIEEAMAFYRERYATEHFIVYFQAYTNTYAPVAELAAIYGRALKFPNVVGMSIGTRPDCVPEAVLDLVAGYAKRMDVWLELGLESSHDRTLAWLNRAHTYAEFEDAVKRASGRGFEIAAHTIFGLPGETREEMLQTAERLALLPVDSVKIHHFYVSRNTVLAEAYARGEFGVMTLDEWAALAADVLERLPESMTIQRLVGELGGRYVVAPLWDVPKHAVLARIEGELERRGTAQGTKAPNPDAEVNVR